MISPEFATAKLVTQFERLPDFLITQGHRDPANPVNHQDIIADVTACVALGFTRTADSEFPPTPGEEFQQLVVWNHWLRHACSERYAELRDPAKYDTEGLEKTDINRDSQLFVLNGIRRGVKRAMKQSQQQAEQWNARGYSAVA
jgi:hypothetical protein